MKKLSFVLMGAMLMCAPVVVNAQISTRTDTPSNLNFGTRPEAGTKLLTFNVDIAPDSGFGLNGNLYNRLGIANGRLFTAKYFLSEKLAVRFGLNLTRSSVASKGDIDTSLVNFPTPDTLVSNDFRQLSRAFLLVPGLEYHFTNSNIFDVYAGGDLILGSGSDVTRNNLEYAKDFYNRMETRTPYFAVGINPVVGFNIFVVDLPVSIGLEYGFNAMWKFGGATKVSQEMKMSGMGTPIEREYYTQETDPFGNADLNGYSSLKRKTGSVNTMNNLRLTLNIYFN